MNWIDDRLAQDKALKQRDTAITSAAPKIYDAIWTCIVTDASDAMNNMVPVSTGGSSLHRTVTLAVSGGKELHL